MKPKIGEKVWTIYDNQILGEIVEFLGEQSFLIEGWLDKYDPEYEYSSYNKTWFRSLEKAKKELYKKYKQSGQKIVIEQYYNTDIYEAIEEEE